MLGEITHLQAIVDDLTGLTEDPHKLPPASEQVTHAVGLPFTHSQQKRVHRRHACPLITLTTHPVISELQCPRLTQQPNNNLRN